MIVPQLIFLIRIFSVPLKLETLIELIAIFM